MDKMLSYKDVVLLPGYSDISSRAELSTKVNFLGHEFDVPVVPANMACCINRAIARELSERGLFYVLHRFYPYAEILNFVQSGQDLKTISISVGVQKKDMELIIGLELLNLRVDFITIDVAHGHHQLVGDMIQSIKGHSSGKFKPKIIAGNVGTVWGAYYLKDSGADAIKVGLSCGKSCTTYNATGVGTPMFSAVEDTAKLYGMIPIIADGQIREVGDISKALVAGASMAMIGSEFARCYDSPATKIGKTTEFFGSASKANTGSDEYIEGDIVYLQTKEESYADYYKQIKQGIQSTMSYAGVRDIRKLVEMSWATR